MGLSGIARHRGARARARQLASDRKTRQRVHTRDARAHTGSAPYLRIVTPSGKAGFVSADAVAPIGNDQICYVKDGGAWKIGGYIGSGEPQ